MKRALRLLTRKSTARWSAEIAGVGLLAVAAWLIAPPLSFLVGGAYLILVANQGGS